MQIRVVDATGQPWRVAVNVPPRGVLRRHRVDDVVIIDDEVVAAGWLRVILGSGLIVGDVLRGGDPVLTFGGVQVDTQIRTGPRS